MRIVIRCSPAQREELIYNGVHDGAALAWAFEKDDLLQHATADAVLDLLYDTDPDSLSILKQLPGLKIINSVLYTLQETDPSFIRINGWPTFLKAPIIEASSHHEDLKMAAEAVFAQFHKTIEWLPDAPGFVVPRIVSMIVNEAFFALAEGISTQAEINTAMKLGTAYPYGPFEWGEKLGLQNIARLLAKLSGLQKRYVPAPLLLQQASEMK